jgi:hypothetical protein
MAAVRTVLLRWRFSARMVAARTPVLYHLVVLNNWLRVRQPHVLVNRDTDLVMDGFPSSANSFGIAALRAAAADSGASMPSIAHHMHCPRQTMLALRRRIPVLLLIRPPRACVPSAITRWPALTPAITLRAYIRYYEALLPYASRCVVGTFDLVTNHFDLLLAEVTARSGLELPPYDPGAPYAAAVYDPEAEGRAERRERVAPIRAELDSPALASDLARAEALYERYATLAARHTGGRAA